MSKFQADHSFDKRKEEASRIRKKFPDRVPIIVEKIPKSELPELDKHKYLVPSDLTVGQFIYVIRKRIKLTPEKALFIFVNNKLPPTASLVSELYEKEKDDDGFLYLSVSSDTVFGRVSVM